MGPTACGLVAGVIDWIEGPRRDQGRPRCPTEAVVETLRFFLREGVQWRELRATGDRVCGATLRRRLYEWGAQALLRRALVVCAAIARLYADAAYHSAANRRLCAAEGILPLIRKRREPHGSGLGTVRCIVEHANAWLLANKRLDRRNDRSTLVIDALLTTACVFVIANRLTDF